jgi:hypothetical protein
MVTPRKPAKSVKAAAPADPPNDFAWTIIRLTSTPAKQIGRVYAPDETTAIAKAIEQFKISEAHRQKLAARRG